MFPALTGVIRRALKAISRVRRNTRWSISLLKMRQLTRSGPENVCRQKPSLNSPRGAVWIANGSHGVMNSSRAASFRRTPFRDIFPTRTPAKTVLSAAHQSAVLLPMALDYLTWPATFGSGQPIGTERITTKLLRQHIKSHGLHQDRVIA